MNTLYRSLLGCKLLALVLLLFSISTAHVAAQVNVGFTKENFPDDPRGLKKAQRALKKAEKYYQMEPRAYAPALAYFLEAYKFNGNDALVNFKIGDCYLHLPEKFKALDFLEKAQELNPYVHIFLDYSLGLAHQYRMDYVTAGDYFRKFQKLYRGSSQDTIDMVLQQIKRCDLGREYLRNPSNHKLENLGLRVNSPFDEYVPLVTADEYMLVFTSRRPNKKRKRVNPYNFDYFEDIYSSFYKNGQWSMPDRLKRPINKKRQNNASVHLSFDGQTIYMYRSKGNGDLYYSTLKGDKWGRIKPFEAINTEEYSESHVSLSYDGRTAYFVSDRPGGYGGSDIWMIQMDDQDRWMAPKNLGPVINTPGNEESPFIHPDGKSLYFSSDGHPGIGGFDIFETVLNDSVWAKPKNLRYPINGPDDDLFFVLTADGMNAYYSSSREGGFGGQDIYMIRSFDPNFPDENIPFKEFDVTLFVGILQDAETGKSVGGKVEITDNSTGEVIWSNVVNSKTGKLTLTLPTGRNYGLAVEAEGYLFHSENFDLAQTKGFKEIRKVIQLKKVNEGMSLVLNNVFFEFNKWDLRPESRAELNRALLLLNRYPKFEIVVEGHTDNIGSDEVNDRISQSRAQAVRDYLVQAGLEATRIVAVEGHGERKPVATNDTPEGRAANRRVELKLRKK